MKEHSDFIDALGGTAAVATLTGQQSNRVSNWRQRGIPWYWRAALAQVASEMKPPIVPPDNFLNPKMREAS